MTAWVDELDLVAEQVTKWATDTINAAFNALSPSGRPWGYVEQTWEERLGEYLQYRGNPEAWAKKIMDDAQSIATRLQNAGLNPDQMLSVHPYDLAQKFNIDYSADMERQIDHRVSNS